MPIGSNAKIRPRSLRPRTSGSRTPVDLVEATALLAVLEERRVLVLGVGAPEPDDVALASVAAFENLAPERPWVEVSCEPAHDALEHLLSRLGLTGVAEAERSDAILDALDERGWDLVVTRPGERHSRALLVLADTLARGPSGPRLIVASALPLGDLPFAGPGAVAGGAPSPRALSTWPLAAAICQSLSACAPLSASGLALILDSASRDVEAALMQLFHAGYVTPDSRVSRAYRLTSEAPPARLSEAGLRALSTSPEAVDRLATIAALLEEGRIGEASEGFERAAETLIGTLPRALVEQVLERTADPHFERWRFELSLFHADLADAPPSPPLSTDADTLAAYAEVLFLRGRLDLASDALGRVHGERSVRLVRIEAIIATMLARGEAEEHAGLARFEASPVRASDVPVKAATRAFLLSILNREDEALEVIASHWSSHFGDLSGLLRRHVIGDTLNALVGCERLDLARRYIAETRPLPVGTLAYTLALVALQSNELGRADTLLTLCEQRFDPLGLWHARTRALRIRWALARGLLSGLEGRIEGLLRDAMRLDDRALWGLGMTYGRALVEMGRPPMNLGSMSPPALPSRAQVWNAVFSGERPSRQSHRQRAWQLILEALGHLRSGGIEAGARAIHACDEALSIARRTGFTLDEIAAARHRLEACLLARDESGLTETLSLLDRLRAREESLSVDLELRLLEAIEGPQVDFQGLLDLTDAFDISPLTARRAQAILLGDAADGRDAVVLRARRDRQTTVAHDPQAPRWSMTWLFDLRERTLLRPLGPPLKLASSPLLWTLLERLAGGECTKEALVLAGWDVSDYHPLRDDNRLQVAIRKLRGFLEDEPGAPRWLLTTSAGYVLAPELRRLMIR